jgi:DNA replication protein DnaC
MAIAPLDTLLESYLRQLKLPSFVQNYAAFAQDATRTELSCERYLLALCEAELAQRDAHRVERCIAQARLPVLKELSQFDWSCVQGVSKTRVFELAQGGYITHAEPILMIGNPGLGKTHVATGLALAACRQGRRVRFYQVTTLVNDLVAAQHELKLSRFLATLCRQDLLILR